MRLSVIEVGPMPEEARPTYTSYPVMIENWLAPALPNASFATISLIGGETLPDPTAFDGYIITGSRYGAYEDLPWMDPLRSFLRAARRLRVPVFGICFGHQIMAQTYGAEVRKSERGWMIGAQPYDYAEGAQCGNGPAYVFHQDQVESVPEGATVIGSSPQCPVGALAYSFPALSVQYHPEFVEGYARFLLEKKRETLPSAVVDAAEESILKLSVDNAATAEWVAGFFRANVEAASGNPTEMRP